MTCLDQLVNPHPASRWYQALRYIQPPELLVNQLNIYTEYKFEDEEDMRDRARSMMAGDSSGERPPSEAALEEVVRLAKQHGELYPIMVDILNHYGEILNKDIDL